MLSNKSICLAYETVEEADHSLPLLIPMSGVAGRMSIQEGARFLEKPQGGKVSFWEVYRVLNQLKY